MRVILLKDVARLGRKSEVKEVPDGHAINFLIPKKMAIAATTDSLKRLTEEVRKHDAGRESLEKSFEDAVHKLQGLNISYPVDANEQRHLYKGISADDIAKHLQAGQIKIEKHHIVLEHPIKDLGTYEIGLVHGKLKGVCTLAVVKK